ncbi:MAG: hypothetical protein IJO81_05205 [Clostridia bacterium]|nr:hypothetical protein [Clostridia bacterium]
MNEYTAIISREAERFIPLLERDFDVLTVAPDRLLQGPVQCHADMIVAIAGNCAVLPESYVSEYVGFAKHLRERCGLKIILSDDVRGADYPDDISLNVLTCARYAFSLKKYTSRSFTDVLERLGYTHLNVRQGYAACSTLSCDGFMITADPSVEKAARSVGLDVLKISEGSIRLDGYGTGFIGGASGVCGNKIYFLGNLMLHPDGEKIREYVSTHGYSVICLSDDSLSDFGGIKFVKNVN